MLLRILVCYFLIKWCTGVYVYIEEGKRRAFTTFPLPVMDGFILTTERNIDVLEFRKLDENETEVTLITNFPNLKYINISYFNFEKLPKFLNLPNAEWLQFSSNKLRKIPHNYISTLPLKEIGFAGNQISIIEDGAIGFNVTDITLDCNLLTEVSARWFRNPSILTILGLHNNQITIIDEIFLESFASLEYLDLSSNKIISIGNGAFSSLSKMISLNLQANAISILQPEIFADSINITKTFNIGRNRLNFLSQDLLKKLHLNEFVILGNPWQCPCLREIEKWMSLNVNSQIYETVRLKWEKNNPVCIVASSFSDQCVQLVDQDLYNSYAENLNIIDDGCLSII